MTESYRLNRWEKVAFRLYVLGNLAKNPFEYTVRNPDARNHMKAFFNAIEEGAPGSRPLIDERWRTFKEFPTEVIGGENIPPKPFTIAMNHYKRGRLRGNWVPSVVFEAIETCLGGSQTHGRYRMVIADSKFHPVFSKIMANVSRISDGIDSGSPREILSTLRDGNVVGIFPSGKDELALHQFNPMAGKLFKLLGRRELPVLPVGTWFDKKKEMYIVNIGEPKIFTKEFQNFSDQTVANHIGIQIAKILPENLRGYYTRKPFRPQ